MKIITITPEMSKEFTSKYASSLNPVFSFSYGGEMGFGYKAIVETAQAVFIYQSSFLNCGGFWMPKNTYLSIIEGKGCKGLSINYNNTYYKY